MTEEFAIEVILLTLRTAGMLCAPPIVTILAVGLITNVFQTVTQMKDPALSFVPKVVAVGLLFMFILPWYLQLVQGFTNTIFDWLGSSGL